MQWSVPSFAEFWPRLAFLVIIRSADQDGTIDMPTSRISVRHSSLPVGEQLPPDGSGATSVITPPILLIWDCCFLIFSASSTPRFTERLLAALTPEPQSGSNSSHRASSRRWPLASQGTDADAKSQVDAENRLVHIPDSKTLNGEGDMPMTDADTERNRASHYELEERLEGDVAESRRGILSTVRAAAYVRHATQRWWGG